MRTYRIGTHSAGVALTMSVFVGLLSSCDVPVGPDDPGSVEAAAARVDDTWADISTSQVPGFAGVFVNEEGTIVVSATDLASRTAARDYAFGWRTTTIEHAASPVLFRLVQYDFAELRAWHDALFELFGDERVTLLDSDEVENAVVVGLVPGGDAEAVRRFAVRAGIPEGALRVVTVGRPVDDTDLRDTYRPTMGGLEIEAAGKTECSLGFNTIYQGDTAFVTASHCSTTRMSASADSGIFKQDASDTDIGYEILDDDPSGGYFTFGGSGYVCSSTPGCRFSDAQVSQYYDTVSVGHGRIAKTTSVSTGSSSGSITLASPAHFNIGQTRGVNDIYVGMTVDKVGRSSGWTREDVTATCVDINHGYVIKACQMVADYYSEGGDSGGPVFIQLPGDTVALVGIHQARNTSNGDRYFSTLDGIEHDLGITLDVIGVAYVSPLVASITGEDVVPDSEPCSWQGWGSAGTSPYSYSWWGVLSGSSQTVSGTVSSSGNLWLEVTDAYSLKDTAQFYVEVDGDLDECVE